MIPVATATLRDSTLAKLPVLAEEAARSDPRFRALHTVGRGKGLAVRTGVLASAGRVAVFCDGRKEQHPLQNPDTRRAPG